MTVGGGIKANTVAERLTVTPYSEDVGYLQAEKDGRGFRRSRILPRRAQCSFDDSAVKSAFEAKKGRFGFKLTLPYTEERRKAASELVKNYTKNLRRNDNENPVV